MSSNPLLFCVLDAAYSVPAKFQHKVIESFCQDRGLNKGFYGTEDQSTVRNGLYLDWKIDNLDNKYAGIVVYSFHQYAKCGAFFSMVKRLINGHKLFCSASEDIVLSSEEEFNEFFYHATIASVSIENRLKPFSYSLRLEHTG
jgi:hypothetical protein